MDQEYSPGAANLPEGGANEDEVTYDDTPLKKFPKIEKEDIYGLTLIDITVEPNPYGEAGSTRRVHYFAVDGFDPEECGTMEYYTAVSGRGDKNAEFAEVFEITFSGPTKVKKSDLIGRRCRGMVAFQKSKKSGKPYPKIAKLLKA